MSIQPVTREQEEMLKRSKIPPAYWPYVNITEVEIRERKRNATDGGVITDEDVADIPDDDENPKRNTMDYDGKKITIPITEEAEKKLYQHWTDQAVSGLMSAHATLKLRNVGHAEKHAHRQCNKGAKTVPEHAKCVLVLLELEKKYQRWLKKFGEKAKRVGRISSLKKRLPSVSRSEQLSHTGRRDFQLDESRRRPPTTKKQREYYPTENGWVGSFRMRAKRSPKEPKLMKVKPVTRDRYDLVDELPESPLGIISKNLLRDIRWKSVIAEFREEAKRIKQQQKMRRNVEKRLNMFFKTLRKEDIDHRESMKKMSPYGELSDAQLDDLMSKAKEEGKKPTVEEKLMKAPMDLIRNAVKIGMIMSGKNTSDFDEKNIDVISPRFFPVVPEENVDNKVKLISPSLFALHDEGEGIEKETSLTKAMSVFGRKDNEALLDFIIEAAGVSDALDGIKVRYPKTLQKNENHHNVKLTSQNGLEVIESIDWEKKHIIQVEHLQDEKSQDKNRQRDNPFYSPEGQLPWLTKENVTELYGEGEKNKIEAFEKLIGSLSPDQLDQMNSTGYTVMDKKQLNVIYGRSSPYHDQETLDRLSNVSIADIPDALDQAVRGLAAETMKFQVQRRKQIVLSPLIFTPVILDPATASQPIILSPLMFDPLILSPSVFGAIVLSPYIFTPVILAPRVLAPIVLSPHIFSPTILSPLVFAPNIVNSGVGNAIILSPLVFSPFILHPVALTPLILSPYVLNPFIGVPHTLSPIILSPFVLSPVVYSPPYYSAFLLSPHALSPAIESEGYCFVSILSPSWLS
ncbi:hypothetical protein NECAME_16759 [Necator americanus]|uniref:Uncharacterized protein n=1 Tax=Necator americanus TaxID=51031 RepID=W2TUG9_NECAM|nr:hypothetical protein NECAME_16759 [Necator americanus]ETN85458.1 hypothetical protein NECAME_16759 [Necator americanus]